MISSDDMKRISKAQDNNGADDSSELYDVLNADHVLAQVNELRDTFADRRNGDNGFAPLFIVHRMQKCIAEVSLRPPHSPEDMINCVTEAGLVAMVCQGEQGFFAYDSTVSIDNGQTSDALIVCIITGFGLAGMAFPYHLDLTTKQVTWKSDASIDEIQPDDIPPDLIDFEQVFTLMKFIRSPLVPSRVSDIEVMLSALGERGHGIAFHGRDTDGHDPFKLSASSW